MFVKSTVRSFSARALLSSMLLAVAISASACGKDATSPEEEEPSVTSMVLTFSNGQTATITGSGNNAVRIPVGATTVSAVFRRADGTPDPIVVTSVFRLEVVAPAGNLSFARNASNSFAGTLTATAATTTAVPVTFSLLHVAENHSDFGPFTVNITVGN